MRRDYNLRVEGRLLHESWLMRWLRGRLVAGSVGRGRGLRRTSFVLPAQPGATPALQFNPAVEAREKPGALDITFKKEF